MVGGGGGGGGVLQFAREVTATQWSTASALYHDPRFHAPILVGTKAGALLAWVGRRGGRHVESSPPTHGCVSGARATMPHGNKPFFASGKPKSTSGIARFE